MAFEKFFGFDKKVDEALKEARGEKRVNPYKDKISELERKLETAKLTQAEITAIQKELKRLKLVG